MISQITESGGISPTTRSEIETFLTDICTNISDFSQLDDYPHLAEFENETQCIEAVISTLDRIPEADNSTDSTGILRCYMLSYLHWGFITSVHLFFRDECSELSERGWLNAGLLGFAVRCVCVCVCAHAYVTHCVYEYTHVCVHVKIICSVCACMSVYLCALACM